MIKVIINADDLGLNHQVNEAISNALREGHITSSTILANSSTWDEIHQIVVANPQASFGIHLNLTEGKALTCSSVLKKYEVVNKDNFFTKKVRDLEDYPQELLDAIFDEWDAQLNKVINIEKISITHVDGHHHIHTFMPFAEVLIKLIQKYNLSRVRNRYVVLYPKGRSIINNLLTSIFSHSLFYPILRKYRKSSIIFSYIYSFVENKLWRDKLNKYVSFTDIFNSYDSQVSSCRRGIPIPDDSTVELMCHPGHPIYISEFEQIRNHELEEVLRQVEYISFNDFK